MTCIQKSFIISIRALDADLHGEALRVLIADEFPPGILFDPEIGRLGELWTGLRTWLVARGVRITQHPTRRIILALATSIYEDADDREAAVELAQRYIASQKKGPPGPVIEDAPDLPDTRHATNITPPDRVTHNIAMRFKDVDAKISGVISQCWQEFVDEYRQVSTDDGLTSAQKLQFIHNILSKDAQRVFVDRVERYATSFEHAVEMIDAEYNSTVR